MKNDQCEKSVASVNGAAKAETIEFKPTITRMDKIVGQVGGVATALSIGIGVAGKW